MFSIGQLAEKFIFQTDTPITQYTPNVAIGMFDNKYSGILKVIQHNFIFQDEEKKKLKEQRQKEIEAYLTAETNNNNTDDKNRSIKIKAVDIAQIKINNKEKGEDRDCNDKSFLLAIIKKNFCEYIEVIATDIRGFQKMCG